MYVLVPRKKKKKPVVSRILRVRHSLILRELWVFEGGSVGFGISGPKLRARSFINIFFLVIGNGAGERWLDGVAF